MHIGFSDRNYHVSGTNIQLREECLLNPKLFKGYFSASLYFLFKFSYFLSFYFHGALHPAMFELDFCTERPAFAEIVAYHDNNVRNVKAAMTWSIAVISGMAVSVYIVTEKVTGVRYFPVTTQAKPGCEPAFQFGDSRGSIWLGDSLGGSCRCAS